MKREDGEILFDLQDSEEWIDVLKSVVKETEIGQEYRRDYYVRENSQDDADKLVEAVSLLFSREDGFATANQVAAALRALILSGKIQPKDKEEELPLGPPVEDTTPRDKNGKPLSSSQILWSEYRQWSESHSSNECKVRARSDEAYGSFYRKNLEREFAEEQVGDAVTPEGQAAPANFQALTVELREFARKYAKEPSNNLRPKGGLVILDGQQMSWTHFQDLMNRATAAGAIR
jgi:hypothetical protein